MFYHFFCLGNFCVLRAYYVPSCGKRNAVELKEYVWGVAGVGQVYCNLHSPGQVSSSQEAQKRGKLIALAYNRDLWECLPPHGLTFRRSTIHAGLASWTCSLFGSTGCWAQKALLLGCSAFTLVKFLIIVERGTPHFHLALDPTHYVTDSSPSTGVAQLWIEGTALPFLEPRATHTSPLRCPLLAQASLGGFCNSQSKLQQAALGSCSWNGKE